jgi:hypothetical protein
MPYRLASDILERTRCSRHPPVEMSNAQQAEISAHIADLTNFHGSEGNNMVCMCACMCACACGWDVCLVGCLCVGCRTHVGALCWRGGFCRS